ncbi:MAG: heme o synthase [Actinomycetota bacterium]
MNRFQKLTLGTAAATVTLFAVGGLVRGTGSGLGCSTWPQCHDASVLPALGDAEALIESSHRGLAGIVGVLLAIQLIAVLRSSRRRSTPALLWPTVIAAPLLLAQAGLGALVVVFELNLQLVATHFIIGTALVTAVTIAAVNAITLDEPERRPVEDAPDAGFTRAAAAAAIATALLLLVGTFVRASNSGLAFTDWPLMDGKLFPTPFDGPGAAMFAHRISALLAGASVLWVFVRARNAPVRSAVRVRLSTLVAVLFVAQVLIGAAQIWSRLEAWSVTAHVALSAMIWALLVALWSSSRRLDLLAVEGPEHAVDTAGDRSWRNTVTAYWRLTKPRIIVLLLITTVPAMILADRGIPSLWLIAATVLGGAIAAGSANAINCYIDRDIDEIMRRTRSRPLPAHQVTPQAALTFGFVLGAISFLFLGSTVNVLAASLALAAIAFYVFVYTMWLKRTSTQNIVIGGAAGAAPALVGWAAVTGTVALPAWILFAIVFVWTPPHFWALAMRYSGDYAAAGIPMLPSVRGPAETRKQILLYSLVLFATTLLLVPFGSMGPVYVATAVILGGVFVWRALQLFRGSSTTPEPKLAMGLFKYSIVYLALLFAAVAVDGAMLPAVT